MVAFKGGAALERKLNEIAAKLKAPAALDVGFPEGDTYPDGKSVAYIAAIQEFGATIEHPGGTSYVFGKDGMARFVKNSTIGPSQGKTGAHTITIPPRPFFRTMIAKKEGEWGKALGKMVVASDYDIAGSLGTLGGGIQGQLQASIRDWTTPPNAKSTIRKKGFNKPLIDTNDMVNSVKFVVRT